MDEQIAVESAMPFISPSSSSSITSSSSEIANTILTWFSKMASSSSSSSDSGSNSSSSSSSSVSDFVWSMRSFFLTSFVVYFISVYAYWFFVYKNKSSSNSNSSETTKNSSSSNNVGERIVSNNGEITGIIKEKERKSNLRNLRSASTVDSLPKNGSSSEPNRLSSFGDKNNNNNDNINQENNNNNNSTNNVVKKVDFSDIVQSIDCEKSSPFTGQLILFFYNFTFSIFTLWSLIQISGEMGTLLSTKHLSGSIMSSNIKSMISLFCISRVFAFIDSVILMAKGRNVSFVHFYRHITSAIFVFHSLSYDIPYVHIFYITSLIADLGVYTYYSLSSIFAKSNKIRNVAHFVSTVAQVLPLVPMMVASSFALYNMNVYNITQLRWNAQLCLIMSVFNLFSGCSFYVGKYMTRYRAGVATFLIMFHLFAIVGIVKIFYHEQGLRLLVEAIILYLLGGFGITIGAHRLWAHRTYKAAFPFRFCIMILNSLANQGSIYHWCRDHRVHHKYSEKDGDPHDARRGFFYAHMGWLLLKKPKAVAEAGKEIDCSDLLQDPIVVFQKVLDPWWNQSVSFLLPSIYGYFMYGDFWLGFFALGALRWIMCLHATWTVNSVAHLWGERPYDASINPAESLFTAVVAVGEGWHNWHHKYAFDYATSEGGIMTHWNPSKLILDIGAFCGLVWDRKRATQFWDLEKTRRAEKEKKMAERAANQNALMRIPSLKESLPKHCTKKSLVRSTLNLLRDVAICSCIAIVAVLIRQSPVGLFCSKTPFFNRFVNITLWAVYALAQGTVAFGLWVVGYEAAGGRFSNYGAINHTVGLFVHSVLLIPYRPRRAHRERERERASLMRCLKEDAWAIFRVYGWTAWQMGVAGTISMLCLYIKLGQIYGAYKLVRWFVAPWIVLNVWLNLYSFLMENGPQDEKSTYDLEISSSTFEYFTAEWLQSRFAQANKTTHGIWLRLVDHLHHHLSLSHIIQAVDFNVPHYHVHEAIKRLGEVLDDFQLEVQEAKLHLLNTSSGATNVAKKKQTSPVATRLTCIPTAATTST